MIRMMHRLLFALLFTIFSQAGFADTHAIIPPQSSSCIQSSFTSSGNVWWKTIYLTLTNTCGQSVDFQNSTITFLNASNLNTTFWGNFNPLSYPVNTLQITSQLQSDKRYLASLSLRFASTGNSKLSNNSSFTIIYGAGKDDYVANSVNVYLSAPANTGEIDLVNTSSKPANVSQDYALVHLTFNGQPLSDAQVPWSNTVKLNALAIGTYAISPVNITDSNGNVYQGTANPSTISLSAGQLINSNITYSMSQPAGSIAVTTQALPSELSGYTQTPSILLTNTSNGSATNASVNWNATTPVSGLVSGKTYSFSTPVISYNGYKCTATFNPTTAIAGTTAPVVNLSYACVQVVQDTVTINVSGLTSSTSSVVATFTPNDGSTPVSQTIALTNGQGSSTAKLTDGLIYTVSSTNVSGYSASYNPQPLTATPNATETISYAQNTATGGRIIGYLTGWKTPPAATDLAAAGYTHMLVAFGVFSTSTPGQITPAFDTVSASYIKSLQNAGIKVLLSLGGASTSIPNTTVNFHQVLTAASSPTAFTQTFIQSLENLTTQYGFDGFDIDIESGLNAGGTFSNPQGDIAVLANIINTMHANHPSLMMTLAPQTANISATSGYSETWGNYAALVMQTYNSLEWVGIQLYNTGCMFGIDHICYDPNATSSPNFPVAMATDLLANWPTSSGFQPYISYLKPSQVVLGFIAPNASGSGDGAPIYPVATIKKAVQCLRTGVAGTNSCGTYVPPKAYPGIGGVFEWEVSFDQNNNYKFATGLKACVVNGVC